MRCAGDPVSSTGTGAAHVGDNLFLGAALVDQVGQFVHATGDTTGAIDIQHNAFDAGIIERGLNVGGQHFGAGCTADSRHQIGVAKDRASYGDHCDTVAIGDCVGVFELFAKSGFQRLNIV